MYDRQKKNGKLVTVCIRSKQQQKGLIRKKRRVKRDCYTRLLEVFKWGIL